MSYKHLLPLCGLVLIALGLVERGWFLVLVWLGADFLIVGLAHWRHAHGVFGKRADGTLPLWSRLLFLPLRAYSGAVWHLLRLLSREPAQSTVTPDLVVGRRLLASEAHGKFDSYVDLTAEFVEPLAIRKSPAYRCFPLLDGSAQTPEALRRAVASLRPGRTFIHCAQGHGRTGLFALAFLLHSGAARSIEDGLQMLRAARPRIHLNKEQQQCIRAFGKRLKEERVQREPREGRDAGAANL
jgi:protein-tyrosine phosphatase